MTTTVLLIRSLRRHYPVQVLGSVAAAALSAHWSRELPVLFGLDSTGSLRWTAIADQTERGEANDERNGERAPRAPF